MDEKPGSLPALIETAAVRHNASGRQLGDMARAEGFRVTYVTVNLIRNGNHKFTPAAETVRAIAWLAGVTDEEAFAAAGQAVPARDVPAADLPLDDESIFADNPLQSLKELIDHATFRRSTSGRQLGMMAREKGFAVTGTTINKIRQGTYHSTPSDETIRAIAWLAGVPEALAFRVAGQPLPGPPLGEELPPGADNLSAKSRKAVIEYTRVLIAHEKQIRELTEALEVSRQS